MSIKQMLLLLLSQPIFISCAADAPAKLTLLDCYKKATVALPGVGEHCAWMAHHAVLPVVDMDPVAREFLAESLNADTTKLLRCCVGSVEGEKQELIDKVKEAISQDLHPQNVIWAHPFDGASAPDLKQFVTNPNMAEQLSRVKAKLSLFRCTDDAPSPCLRTTQAGLLKPSIIVPSSFKDHLMAMMMHDIGREAEKIRMMQQMLQKKEITPELIALLDAYSRRQGVFHEASYLVLKPATFAAFAAQEFGSEHAS